MLLDMYGGAGMAAHTQVVYSNTVWHKCRTACKCCQSTLDRVVLCYAFWQSRRALQTLNGPPLLRKCTSGACM